MMQGREESRVGSVRALVRKYPTTALADTLRSALVILLLKWVLAGAVAAYWLRRTPRAPVATQGNAVGAP
jgi:hypothetical protein